MFAPWHAVLDASCWDLVYRDIKGDGNDDEEAKEDELDEESDDDKMRASCEGVGGA